MESLNCLLCNFGEESIEHMILECDWTRGVWFACCQGLKICRRNVLDSIYKSFFKQWMAKSSAKGCGNNGELKHGVNQRMDGQK